MTIEGVPYRLLRGGTSKCHAFGMEDVPSGAERSAFLLRALGSPDIRQIDGLGGATSLTSKALLIRPADRSERPADVAFLFAQVAVDEARVDYGGTCGNCTSAVAVYAIESGLVPPTGPVTSVRIRNLNTDSVVTAEVPVLDGRVLSEGDQAIDGVPGTGAAIKLWFDAPVGSFSGKLHPTDRPFDRVVLSDSTVPVSTVDVVNTVAFVQAEDVDALGTELPDELTDRTDVMRRLLEIRAWLAEELGLVHDRSQAEEISPGFPKVAMVGPPRDYVTIHGSTVDAGSVDVVARTLSMGKPHAAFALSSAICTAVAATLSTTTVGSAASALNWRSPGAILATTVRVGHPSGVTPVDLEFDHDGRVQRAGVVRTARSLIEGRAMVRR